MSVCAACQEPLVISLEPSDDDDGFETPTGIGGETVPDDVALTCGCHFHWQCLLDTGKVAECPNCNSLLLTVSPTGGQQLLCNLYNEGGLQENFDLFPILTEEAYLKAHPEERRCRAFLEFCKEGDIPAILDCLSLEEDSDEHMEDDAKGKAPARTRTDVLRYQDSLGDMRSALHAAVYGASQEVAWLLLLLASNLDLRQMPAEVLQDAETLGVRRDDQTGKVDIRSLKDSQGRTAEDLASEMGGVWSGWPGTGRLAI